MRRVFALLVLVFPFAFGQSPQLNLSQLADQLHDGGLVPSSALYQLWPETTAERSVSGLTIKNYMHPPGNVYRYGAVGDGSVDDSVAIQDAIYQACSGKAGAAAAYLPAPSIRYLMSQSVIVSTNNGCEIYGDGKYQTYIRYTGTGTWLSSTDGNQAFNIHDFTLQLAGYNAVGLDVSQMWSTTIRSVRIAAADGALGTTGILADITSTSMASFWNVLSDDTFDSLGIGISLQCLASARANRWRIVAPTFLQETTGLDLRCVDGIQIIAPYFDQLTGAALSLGASADGVQVFEATQETESGGWFLTVNSAANAFQVLGFRNYGGRLYEDGTAQLGTRAFFLGDWADGLNWSSSSAGTPVSTLAPNADGGLQASGIATIAVGGGVPETSSGVTCSMDASENCTADVPSGSAHCAAYAQGASAYYAACEISGTTATVTANASNSATWLVVATQ